MIPKVNDWVHYVSSEYGCLRAQVAVAHGRVALVMKWPAGGALVKSDCWQDQGRSPGTWHWPEVHGEVQGGTGSVHHSAVAGGDDSAVGAGGGSGVDASGSVGERADP